MNKKEFYEAPEWGLRTLMLERRILDLSDGVNTADVDGGVSGDDTYNDRYGDL